MSDISVPRSQRPHLLAPVRKLTQGSRPVLLAALLGLSSTLVVGAPLALAAPISDAQSGAIGARAILNPIPRLLDDNADMFTLGVLTDPNGDKIKIRLRNGDTQTFKVDGDTVFRDEDGNRKSQDDLQEGDVVIVTTNGDNDDTADLLVDGGANGFRQGGTFDVGNRMDDRGRWDWRARSNEAPPFDPRRLGAIFHGFHRPGAFGGPVPHQQTGQDSGGGDDHSGAGGVRRFTWHRSR